MTHTERSIGIIPARFHTPDLHDGHRFLIAEVCKRHKDVLIVLGVSPGRLNDRNTFPFEMRAAMIRQAFQNREFTIIPGKSLPASDDDRSRFFDERVEELFHQRDAVIYGSRESFIQRYTGRFPVQEIETIYTGSATEIRKNIPLIHSSEFRQGYGRAIMDLEPMAYQSVDVAVVDHGQRRVILVGKAHESGWRFPGSFFKIQEDDDFESAARRTLKKELPTIVAAEPRALQSKRIMDWRYKGTRDGILTMLMVASYESGEPLPGKGIERASWFTFDSVCTALIRAHVQLGDILSKHFFR